MGRPSKLTPTVQAHIVEAIRLGNYAQVAARGAGIHEATFFDWMARGERETEGIFHDFANAVKEAEAEAEARAVSAVVAAFPDSWQAAMTYLERKFSDRWRRRDRVENANAPNEPYKIYVNIDDSKI